MSTQIRLDATAKYPYNTPTGYDYKAWAKRIQYREEHGDKELTTLQIKFAKEALDRTAGS